MMKIQGLNQLKPRTETKNQELIFLRKFSRNKNWILCDDKNRSRCNHNLDGSTTENNKLGMELP